MTPLSTRAYDLRDRLRRLGPRRSDPHWEPLEKSDLERGLTELAWDIQQIERTAIETRKDAQA